MKAVNLKKELIEQYVLAGSENARIEQLRLLSEHYCDKIRLRVAENPKTPPDILWSLSQDANHDVRIAVAGNPACEQSVLDRLAKDADVIVRHGIAQNILTPLSVLQLLADDDNGWVRGEAVRSLDIIASHSGDEVANRRMMRQERNRSRVSDLGSRTHNDEAAS